MRLAIRLRPLPRPEEGLRIQQLVKMRPEDPDAEYKYRYVLMPMRI